MGLNVSAVSAHAAHVELLVNCIVNGQILPIGWGQMGLLLIDGALEAVPFATVLGSEKGRWHGHGRG